MQFESVLQELESGISIFPALLSGVTPDQARAKPDLTSWSILETMCHLLDEEREDFRVRLDILLHRADEDWPPIDPAAWVTLRDYNARDLYTVLNDWVAERRTSLDWLRSLEAPDWDTPMPTPWEDLMPAGMMLSAWAAHDGLHQRQIIELRRQRLGKLVEPFDPIYAGSW